MTTHVLKCWPQFFEAILSGEKTFDVRKGDDRSYVVGDWLHLREFDLDSDMGYTGRYVYKQISYIMHGGKWLPSDTWALGFKV